MTTDHISDMMIRIQNGYMAGKVEVVVSWSKFKESLGKVLVKTGYLSDEKVVSRGGFKDLVLKLRYTNKQPAMEKVRMISKQGGRVYIKKNKLRRVLGGLGIAVVSTTAGLVTDREAREMGLGGEVICEIW